MRQQRNWCRLLMKTISPATEFSIHSPRIPGSTISTTSRHRHQPIPKWGRSLVRIGTVRQSLSLQVSIQKSWQLPCGGYTSGKTEDREGQTQSHRSGRCEGHVYSQRSENPWPGPTRETLLGLISEMHTRSPVIPDSNNWQSAPAVKALFSYEARD